MEPHQAVVERVAQSSGVVLLFGGLDTGKTTLGRAIAAAALRNGREVAYLDADLGLKAVGPPATVALKMIHAAADLERDAMSRVGKRRAIEVEANGVSRAVLRGCEP